jgi:site-specific recombinase XerD
MMLSQQETTLTAESIERFRSTLFVRGKSEKTLKAYTTDLRMMLQDMGLAEVDHQTFEEVGMTWLQKNREELAPKTTGRRLTSLRAYAKWAGMPSLFSDYAPPVASKGIPHPLPEGMDGVRRLLAVARNERQAAFISLCGFCGLRAGEALSVRVSDFDLTRMILTVRGKGDRTRKVPISQEAWDWLAVPVTRAFCAKSTLPVVNLKDRFARRTVTQLGVKAQLQRPISSHDLRATFATAVYNKTKDQRVVQELLGHATGKQTELYIEVAEETQKKAVEDL